MNDTHAKMCDKNVTHVQMHEKNVTRLEPNVILTGLYACMTVTRLSLQCKHPPIHWLSLCFASLSQKCERLLRAATEQAATEIELFGARQFCGLGLV